METSRKILDYCLKGAKKAFVPFIPFIPTRGVLMGWRDYQLSVNQKNILIKKALLDVVNGKEEGIDDLVQTPQTNL